MNDKPKMLLSERACLLLCVALGALQAWLLRYAMSSDGVSYLDIADAYFRGDWKSAINAYWSPLYSWCLGLALYLVKPSIWWEFITVNTVNFLIYVGALFCFRFLLHCVVRSLRENVAIASSDSVPLSESALQMLGYSLFLWCSLILIEVGKVAPDLLAAGLVFLIAGCLVELSNRHSYAKFALFGALAGVAYLARSIMFPLGFGLLAILLFSGKRSKTRVLGVLLSAAAFLIVCSPFILALSKTKGRFTFGDTGKLAYAEFVSPRPPGVHWQGKPAGSGTPMHPTRKLLDDPPVFEFGEPISGTYPPCDDPSYWNEGMRWRFRLRDQLHVLVAGALTYERLLLLREPGLLAGVLVLLFVGGKDTRKAIATGWPLLAVAGLSLAAYLLVLVLDRYIGTSMVLLFLAVFAGIRLPKNSWSEATSTYLSAAIALAVVLTVGGHLIENTYATTFTVGTDPPAKDQAKAALGLENLGLRPGDKVAVFGPGSFNLWARLGRFKIVAEAAAADANASEFWTFPTERRDLAYAILSRTGAKAVIAWEPPLTALDSRWNRVSSTNYYVYFFP